MEDRIILLELLITELNNILRWETSTASLDRIENLCDSLKQYENNELNRRYYTRVNNNAHRFVRVLNDLHRELPRVYQDSAYKRLYSLVVSNIRYLCNKYTDYIMN